MEKPKNRGRKGSLLPALLILRGWWTKEERRSPLLQPTAGGQVDVFWEGVAADAQAGAREKTT